MKKSLLPLKLKIHQECLSLLNKRISETETNIHVIREEAQANARSSAGDKYETDRSMADFEIEKQQKNLDSLLQMSMILNKIDPTTLQHQTAHGTLIDTDKGYIYISVGLGRVQVDHKEVLVISMGAPIVDILKRTGIGEKAVFNGTSYQVKGMV